MKHQLVNLNLLFDAEEYWNSVSCPWTFFAYPTSVAVADGLPPDEDAIRLLGEVQACGIEVAVWVWHITNTTYFACKEPDRVRLGKVLSNIFATGRYGDGFFRRRSAALLELAEGEDC